jgi:hypothetical protein
MGSTSRDTDVHVLLVKVTELLKSRSILGR